MKRLFFICACVVLLAACEDDGNNTSRFDDLITSFDLSQMDQDQFVAALTTEMLCMNDMDVYSESEGWGTPLLGGKTGWLGILCSPDGVSKYIAEFAPTGLPEGIYCTSGNWEYNSKTGVFIIDTYKDTYKNSTLKSKVVYYKYPRLILEEVRGESPYIYRWDCAFSKENPQTLLDSCTIFIDAHEK